MRKCKLLLIFLGITLLVCFAVGCAPKAPEAFSTTEPTAVTAIESGTIKIAISEWEPYTGETIKDQGMMTVLSVAALEKAGYKTEVTLLPWPRCLDMTTSGEMDAIVGASYTEERTAIFSYPEVLWPSQVAFFSATGKNATYESLEKLAPATIGVFNGSQLIPELEKVKGIKLELVETVEQNIQKLASGRVDYMIDSKDSVQYILGTKLQAEASKIQLVQPAYSQDDLYIAFSKKNPDYEKITKDFNEGLAAIKADGTYDKIVSDYGLK